MVKINKINTKNVIASFNKFGDETIKTVEAVVKTTSGEIERNAKELASVKRVWDNGDLAQNIRSEENGTPLSYKVTAYMPYSAYHEFGTGVSVNVPSEWHDMAMQFKGNDIKQVNLMPRPFMYPAFVFGRMRFNKSMRDELKNLTKHFSK